MNTHIIYEQAFLSLLLRTVLGIVFIFQGYDKVVRLGIKKVTQSYQYELSHKKLPGWLIYIAAFYTSYIELAGGLFLITGVFTSYVLYLLGIDLVLVTIALSLIHPVWDMKILFPRLVMISVLLYLPPSADVFSLGHVFNIR